MTTFLPWRRTRRRPAPVPPVRLRPMCPDDPAVSAVFDGLSAPSRRQRFHAPAPRMTDALSRTLHEVDGRRRVGLVAEVRDESGHLPVGIARLARTDWLGADVAVEVVDRWQGRGVGHLLLAAVSDLAREYGYRELYAELLPDNDRALRMLRRVLPASHVARAERVVRVSCPLDWSDITLDVHKLLADVASRARAS